jgi:hypothetical protein
VVSKEASFVADKTVSGLPSYPSLPYKTDKDSARPGAAISFRPVNFLYHCPFNREVLLTGCLHLFFLLPQLHQAYGSSDFSNRSKVINGLWSYRYDTIVYSEHNF